MDLVLPPHIKGSKTLLSMRSCPRRREGQARDGAVASLHGQVTVHGRESDSLFAV